MANCCVIVCLFIFFWLFWFPIALVVYILYLPIKLVRCCFGCEPAPKPPEIEVVVTESEQAEPKDELFFIHGYPDNGEVWDKQVEVMKKEYRCIVVTLPNFGKENNPRSWGVEIGELVRMLYTQIEKHSKKK